MENTSFPQNNPGDTVPHRKSLVLISVIVVLLLLVGVGFFLASRTQKGSPTPKKGIDNLVPSGTTRDQTVKGQIVVKFKEGVTDAQINAKLKPYNAKIIGKVAGINNTIIEVPPGQENAILTQLSKEPIVNYAEHNYIQHVQFIPNDTYFANQWGLVNTGQQIRNRIGIANDDIHVKTAWDITQGAGVKVAVLDTGIDLSHPDLAGKVVGQKVFTTNSIDDKYGHGTHVAGVIAADTNNSQGIAGVCPQCQLLIGKAIGDDGSGDSANVSQAIIWAADNGAKVINVSLGGDEFTQTQQAAVTYAWNKGAVIVGAAGNNNSTQQFFPGAMTNVVSVAATDSTDAKASFSNFGSWVTVAAPGVDVFSTVPIHAYNLQQEVSSPVGTSYAYLSGTSMAAPVVSGAVALIWASPQGTSNSNVVQRLYTTADRINGTGQLWQKGRINVANAIGTPPTPTPTKLPTPTLTLVPTVAHVSPTVAVTVSPTGILTPTLFCLGSCPTLPPSPTTALPTNAQTITPGQTTIPSQTSGDSSISPETSFNPCQTAQSSNVEAAHRGRHHRHHSGSISNFFQQLLEILKQLIGLLGGNGGGSGGETTPTPTPCPSVTPTTEPESSLAPSEALTPTDQPTVTLAATATITPNLTITEIPTSTPSTTITNTPTVTSDTPTPTPSVAQVTETLSPTGTSPSPTPAPSGGFLATLLTAIFQFLTLIISFFARLFSRG